MKTIRAKANFVACVAAMSLALVGCGSDTSVDTSYQKEGLEKATAQRKIFDGVKGDWDKLSEADKAAFTKSAGGDAVNAQAAWLGMKNGPMAAQDYLRQNGRLH